MLNNQIEYEIKLPPAPSIILPNPPPKGVVELVIWLPSALIEPVDIITELNAMPVLLAVRCKLVPSQEAL